MKKITIFLILLLTIPAFSADYNRSNWKHWVDDDKDGQDTRQEILIRDNIGKLKFETNKKRIVVSGKWICPYTGKTFYKASDMAIDHIVSFKEAWKSGAKRWANFEKEIFANDPLNLLAVGKKAKLSKGDKSVVEWKPSMKDEWFMFADKWKKVKDSYALDYSKAELVILKSLKSYMGTVKIKPKYNKKSKFFTPYNIGPDQSYDVKNVVLKNKDGSLLKKEPSLSFLKKRNKYNGDLFSISLYLEKYDSHPKIFLQTGTNEAILIDESREEWKTIKLGKKEIVIKKIVMPGMYTYYDFTDIGLKYLFYSKDVKMKIEKNKLTLSDYYKTIVLEVKNNTLIKSY